MSITLKTQRMLWGRAANRCAICRNELVIDATETDDESVVGEECHIVAKSKEGPRGNSSLTDEQRSKFNNLILLCCTHHKTVDDQPGEYTVDRLTKMKADHENWVRSSLSVFDPEKQHDDEQYAGIIQEFCDRAGVDNWEDWTSDILGDPGIPKISINMHTRLVDLQLWLLSRVWPGRYPEIEKAFRNFRLVLNDFLSVFSRHSEPFGDHMLGTERFYRIDAWDADRYHRLSREHEFHVDLVKDLVLELTRAGNYLCDCIRENYFPTFRLHTGKLLVWHGPCTEMTYTASLCEYRSDERQQSPHPYPSLEKFKSMRSTREQCFGHGETPLS